MKFTHFHGTEKQLWKVISNTFSLSDFNLIFFFPNYQFKFYLYLKNIVLSIFIFYFMEYTLLYAIVLRVEKRWKILDLKW